MGKRLLGMFENDDGKIIFKMDLKGECIGELDPFSLRVKSVSEVLNPSFP